MTVQLLNLVVTVVRKVVLIIMMKVALMTIATLIMTKLVTLNSTYQGIQPNHPFKVTVKLKGYDANSTINNFNSWYL